MGAFYWFVSCEIYEIGPTEAKERRLVQDGRVEGRALTPSCESTTITANCWTVIDRKTLELTKKDTPHPKTKEKPQWDGRRGTITMKSNPITAGWVTHKQENNYTTEVHPLEWRFWAPRQASQPGGLAMGGGIPRESDFEGWWDLIAGLREDWGKRESTLGGHTQSSVLIKTQGEGLNQTYLLVLEGLLQRWGVAVAHHGDKDTGSWNSGNYSLAWALPESAISQRVGSLQGWVASRQTTNKEGTQPHPSADKQIKVLLSSAHQSNTQLYPPAVPPIRKLAQAT